MSTVLDETRDGNKAQEIRETSIETEEYKKRLDLLHKVAQRASSVSEVSNLLDQILRVTQQTLQASASSVLLIDQGKGELYFRVAEGKAANELSQVRLSPDSGIVGWVVRYAQPTLVNDVTKDPRFNKEIDRVTGFVTKSVLAVPLVTGREVIGVLEVLNKADGSAFSERDLEVLTALASTEVLITLVSTAIAALSSVKLQQAVPDGYKSTVEALVATVDAKDPYAYAHSERVREYALLGASFLSLSPQELQAIELGALIHDIGKIGVDYSILRKSGDLTREEWSVMYNHPVIGAKILGKGPSLEMARDIVLHHHERHDGEGYPEGLKGGNISIGARLVAVVDAFDTMTTARSYRDTLSVDDALSELLKHASTQFCPVAVEAFISGFKKHKEMSAMEEAERVAEEQAQREAEEARKAEEAERLMKEEAAREAEEQAQRAAEEAGKAKEAEKLAKKEAERTVEEQAQREAEEARKAEEAERLMKEEAERTAEEQAQRAAEEARKAQEAEKLAKKEAERAAKEQAKRAAEEARKAKETEKSAHDVGSEIYEGNIRLMMPSPVGFGPVMQFKRCIEKVENLRIVMVGGSVDEGATIVVKVQKPIALIRILNEIPAVEKVDKQGENIVVMLKTSAVS